MTYIYGIDFGTTNSTLAVLDLRKKEVVQLFTIPSLLFFPDKQEIRGQVQYYTGQEAVEHYVASRMQGRFMKSIKKVLPNRSFTDTHIVGRRFKAEDLVAMMIRHLKNTADAWCGEIVNTAVIGRPVIFDENPEKDMLAQERLAKAVELAGFINYSFQMEPVGAAFTYERQITQRELVLVGDFGGGTSDFSLVYLDPTSIRQNDRSTDMISKGGIYIGGDNFESDIMWHRGTPHFGRGVKEEFEAGKWVDLPLSYFHNICSWEKMNFLDNNRYKEAIKKSYIFSGRDSRVKNLQTLIEDNLGYMLFREIERTKIHLSHHDTVDLQFDHSGIELREHITLGDFSETIIHKNLQKIEDYLINYLDQQAIRPDSIQSVFLTGGTSYIRPLQQIFHRIFGSEKIKSGDQFNSVAIGLAYSYLHIAQPQQ